MEYLENYSFADILDFLGRVLSSLNGFVNTLFTDSGYSYIPRTAMCLFVLAFVFGILRKVLTRSL